MSARAPLLALCCSLAAAAGPKVFEPGHETEILALAAPFTLGGTLEGDFRLGDVRIERDHLEWVVWSAAKQPVCTLTVTPTSTGGVVSAAPALEQLEPPARAAAEALARALQENLARAVLPVRERVEPVVVSAPPPAPSPRRWVTRGAPLAVLGFLALVLAAAVRARVARAVLLGALAAGGAAALFTLEVTRPLAVSWALGCVVGAFEPPRGRPWLRRAVLAALGGLGLAAAALAPHGVDPRREAQLVALALCVAVGWAVLAAPQLGWGRARRRATLGLAAQALGVLAVSAVVRLALTQPNVLTDGGSGYTRLNGGAGFAALGLLASLWAAEPLTLLEYARWATAFNTLAAPALTLACRGLGLKRPVAVLAGLMLACWPLHAALYSSDLELGGAITFALSSLALVSLGLRLNLGALLAAGLGVGGLLVWVRPEAVLGLVPVALLVLRMAGRRAALSAAARAALVWACALVALRGTSLPPTQGAWTLAALLHPPWARFLFDERVLPFWLWALAPWGLATLPRRARPVVLLAFGAGLLPAMRLDFDVTDTWQETLRYGSWAWVWLAVGAANGLERALARVPRPRVRRVLAAAGVLLVLSAPLRQRAYLRRTYRPTQELAAFEQALLEVPAECELVVPDDELETRASGYGVSVLELYTGHAAVLASRGHAVPKLTGVSAAAEPAAGCRYFFFGHYCLDGVGAVPRPGCDAFLSRAALTEVARWPGQALHHRTVVYPDAPGPRFNDPARAVTLSRVGP
ncbi:MAG: hypothetical protein IPJ65_26080 [Archangiaceae bacterium]|nr:hypothetical protein [Archangiaceae bacterium]